MARSGVVDCKGSEHDLSFTGTVGKELEAKCVIVQHKPCDPMILEVKIGKGQSVVKVQFHCIYSHDEIKSSGATLG